MEVKDPMNIIMKRWELKCLLRNVINKFMLRMSVFCLVKEA